jgi:hypothetical protein
MEVVYIIPNYKQRERFRGGSQETVRASGKKTKMC